MISEETINELKKLSLKNPILSEVIDFIKEVQGSPYYESYLSSLVQLQFWNEELKLTPSTINVKKNEESTFQSAHKFVTTKNEIIKDLDFLRQKLLPNQIKEAEKEATSVIDEARIHLKNRKLNGAEVSG